MVFYIYNDFFPLLFISENKCLIFKNSIKVFKRIIFLHIHAKPSFQMALVLTFVLHSRARQHWLESAAAVQVDSSPTSRERWGKEERGTSPWSDPGDTASWRAERAKVMAMVMS